MKVVLFDGGLFQIYVYSTEIFSGFKEMSQFVQKNIQKLYPTVKVFELEKLFEFYEIQTKIVGEINSQQLVEEFNSNLKLLTQETNDFNYKNILHLNSLDIIPLKFINQIIEDKNELIFLYSNLMDLLLDLLYLININLDISNISFALKSNQILMNEIKNCPKNYIIFDKNVENLYHYHINGSWVVYLTLFEIVRYESNSLYRAEFNEIKEKNKKIFEKHGNFLDFQIFSFIEINKYIKILQRINEENPKELCKNNQLLVQELKRLKTIICLVYNQFLFKKKELTKVDRFLSSEKIYYKSIINHHISINEPFHVYFGKKSCKADYSLIQEFKEMQKQKTNKIFLINLSLQEMYQNRDLMVDYLQKFKEKINSEKIKIPRTIPANLTEVNTVEKLNDFIKIKNLNYPIIMKYSGPELKYMHLLVILITPNCIEKYIEFIKEYCRGTDENDISLIIQSFVCHGGYAIKGYYINRKSYFYFRPSFPDAKEEMLDKFEEYKNGFFHILTDQMVEQDFIDFWKRTVVNNDIKNLVDLKFLEEIMKKYEEVSEDTLFGIDFLYDYQNALYYIVDINQNPGYKELKDNFNQILTEHIISYVNFKSK